MSKFKMTAVMTAVTCICFFGTVGCSKAEEKAAAAAEPAQSAPQAEAKSAAPAPADAPVPAPAAAPAAPGKVTEFAGMSVKEDAKAPAKTEAAAPPKINPNAPVVIVNGNPLTRAEFNRGMKVYVAKLSRATGGKHSASIEPNDQMKLDVLDEMIADELLYEEGAKNEPKDLDASVEKEYVATKGRFKSEEDFKKAMETDNLDEKSLRTLIRKGLVVNNYVTTVLAPTVKVSDEDAKKFYDTNPQFFKMPEQVNASHILVKTEKGASEEQVNTAKKKAEDILASLKGGADFAEAAKKNSECPSASQGGELGVFQRGQMVKPFEEAAFAMKKGEMSGLVQTDFGFHIIKVTDRNEEKTVSFEEAKAKIVEYLTRNGVPGAVKTKVESLKQAAKVDLVAPHL